MGILKTFSDLISNNSMKAQYYSLLMIRLYKIIEKILDLKGLPYKVENISGTTEKKLCKAFITEVTTKHILENSGG